MSTASDCFQIAAVMSTRRGISLQKFYEWLKAQCAAGKGTNDFTLGEWADQFEATLAEESAVRS